MMTFSVRRMQPSDLDAALKLTQAEGWPHCREDWDFHYRLGRGWVVCGADGSVVGTALWWPCGSRAGTLGLVVVDSGYRGCGVGRRLMESILADAGPRSLQLVATRSGIPLYHKCGFREVGQIQQWQGVPASIVAGEPADLRLRKVVASDFPSLCKLDTAAFGAERSALLRAVLECGEGILADKGGRPAGFGLIRPAGRGRVIGPLVASDESVAKALVSRLLSANTGFVRLDIPSAATALAELSKRFGLALVDQVTTMVNGDMPDRSHTARVFGLASQAFG